MPERKEIMSNICTNHHLIVILQHVLEESGESPLVKKKRAKSLKTQGNPFGRTCFLDSPK